MVGVSRLKFGRVCDVLGEKLAVGSTWLGLPWACVSRGVAGVGEGGLRANLEPKFSMDAYSKLTTFRTPKSVLMNNKKSVDVLRLRFGHMSNLRGLCFVSTHFQYFFLTLTDAFGPLCELDKRRRCFSLAAECGGGGGGGAGAGAGAGE